MGGRCENTVGLIAAGRSNFRRFDSYRSFALRELGQLARDGALVPLNPCYAFDLGAALLRNTRFDCRNYC